MTDYDGPPLTRRERKERERAAAESTGQTPVVDAPISPTSAPAPSPTAEAVPEPDETQAIDVSELIADLRPQSTPAPDGRQEAPAGVGRFFSRRGPVVEQQPELTRAQQMPRIEVEELDTVDDAEVDRVEIDEVTVADAPVSSRRIAESTPAQLEDHRAPSVDDDGDAQPGPARATGRVPVVVNVVEDTARHHIADLREDTSAISASSVGTGTSTITANALVLPASGVDEPITVETADGVIVTGSIDLPDGFASSGRGRGTIDTADVDSVDDAGEVRSPETQPVRASSAVSSYANARVRIAPQRRPRNMVPIIVGVGGGVGIAAITVTVVAFIVGWI